MTDSHIEAIIKARHNPEVTDNHLRIAIKAIVELARVEGHLESATMLETALAAQRAIKNAQKDNHG